MYVIVEPTSNWNEDDLRIFYDAVRECEYAILSDTEVKRADRAGPGRWQDRKLHDLYFPCSETQSGY